VNADTALMRAGGPSVSPVRRRPPIPGRGGGLSGSGVSSASCWS